MRRAYSAAIRATEGSLAGLQRAQSMSLRVLSWLGGVPAIPKITTSKVQVLPEPPPTRRGWVGCGGPTMPHLRSASHAAMEPPLVVVVNGPDRTSDAGVGGWRMGWTLLGWVGRSVHLRPVQSTPLPTFPAARPSAY